MKLISLLASAAMAATLSAQAQQSSDHSAHHPPQAGSPAAAPALLSEGEVRKVDTAQGKLTLRHGPLSNLNMPPMTMVFTAADRKLLDGLKPGDKVRFTADQKEGVLLVTALEVVR